jgi:hypothetical protein
MCFREDGWITERFEKTPKMSTYTLAIVICRKNYTHLTRYLVQGNQHVTNVSMQGFKNITVARVGFGQSREWLVGSAEIVNGTNRRELQDIIMNI